MGEMALIDPPLRAFRRRALELNASAARERENDLDSGLLLLFYAVECALKFLYMSENMLKSSSDSRGSVRSAKDLGHDVVRLINEIKIPRASVPLPPTLCLQRSGDVCATLHAHQAWRYGEKLNGSQLAWDWLSCVMKYCEERL